MKLLLDTCTFLWIAGGTPISDAAGAAYRDPSNEVYLSAASVWEITIKHQSGRLALPEPPHTLIPAERRLRGVAPLPISEDSVYQLPKLPQLHRDPFDRILVCQAIAGSLAIITPDPLIHQYPVRVIW
jgi:PIN domain nuclease of toxin-antitoxin system